jgi:hypothetical protein
MSQQSRRSESGKDHLLDVREDWQTRARGDNAAEYEIYVACVSGSGQPIKSYHEWLNS